MENFNYTGREFSIIFLIIFLIPGCQQKLDQPTGVLNQLNKYNVVWDSPSKDCLGSMPLGNGDIGLNVWVEKSGDICFYISKTDSWGDNARLLKVGKVRIKLNPEKDSLPAFNQQVLHLADGSVKIQFGEDAEAVKVLLWVDANHPVVNIDIDSKDKVGVVAINEMWRNKEYPLESISHGDIMFHALSENGLKEPVIIEPDQILKNQKNQIGWFHHNIKSIGPEITAIHQGFDEIMIKDPLLHRTFGAIIEAENASPANDKTLKLSNAKKHYLKVHVLTNQPSSPDEWLEDMEKSIAKTAQVNHDERWRNHKKWWSEFWNRSWIHISENGESGNSPADDDAFFVSQGYSLQRFISACAARGNYPIKFNGSIFTVAHPDKPGGADYRRWGPAYWWQNTRLPYISMCASGDFEMMKPLFKFYLDDLSEFFRERTELYFGHEGLFINEEIYIWGGVPMETYGWDSNFQERTDKLQTSGFHKYEWVSGLELLHLMLDYYAYTEDQEFLSNRVLPFAHEVLTFFDRHYKTNQQGKLVMYPSQALETWWDCTNPMPELAGLYATLSRLSKINSELTSMDERKFWNDLYSKLPEIPLREVDDIKMLAPAERYDVFMNVESPEMYSVYPFRLYGIGNPNIAYGIEAMKNRSEFISGGWNQEDIFYAYLGETEKAKKVIVNRARGKDATVRFPAFWGPNFDWTPDQDHGGVLVKAVQSLVLQTDGDKIYLLPAWPKDWDVEFKLHAPKNTIIEVKYKNGKISDLKVTPKEREKDIVFKL